MENMEDGGITHVQLLFPMQSLEDIQEHGEALSGMTGEAKTL